MWKLVVFDPESTSRKPRHRAANDNGPTTLNVRSAAEITPKPIDWLWPGVLPKAFCLIGGDPGVGKSQATASIAAIVTTGREWPASCERATVGNVIMLATEDSPEYSIVPRLMAAGADRSRVHIVLSAGVEERSFNLAKDIPLMRE